MRECCYSLVKFIKLVEKCGLGVFLCKLFVNISCDINSHGENIFNFNYEHEKFFHFVGCKLKSALIVHKVIELTVKKNIPHDKVETSSLKM